MSGVTESIVEQAALAWLESPGWRVRYGLEVAPGEPGAERANGACCNVTRATGAGATA